MTTVVDPAGTPQPVYNRSGTTVVPITANGTNQVAGTRIVAVSQFTVAVVTCPDVSNSAVVLPSGAEIGSVVEIYSDHTGPSTVNCFAETGDTIIGNRSQDGFALYYRKISATQWGQLR